MMLNKKPKNKLDSFEQVYGYAMNLLNYRDYSSKDMLLKLKSKGANEDDAQNAVAKLTEHRFINEEHYAQQVYRAWLSKKTYGRQHLAMELYRKNVAEECVPEIMAAFTAEDELLNAERATKEFISRNRRKLQNFDDKLVAAAARFMTNRGFATRYIQVLLEAIRAESNI
ncbi:MAG: regulatory protein RecX [Phascolarctobacterium sp.]|nr:regulatory protein RecX [Phascolarctobacterium sp.]